MPKEIFDVVMNGTGFGRTIAATQLTTMRHKVLLMKRGGLLVSPESLNAGTEDWTGDNDIDDAQGLEHVFQLVHTVTAAAPTRPSNIYEILVDFQQLNPGYSLTVGESIRRRLHPHNSRRRFVLCFRP